MAEEPAAVSKNVDPDQVSDWAGDLIRNFDADKFLPDAAQPWFQLLLQYPLISIILMAALGYLVGMGLQWLLRTGLGHVVKKTQADLDDRLLQLLSGPVVSSSVIVFVVLAVKSLKLDDTLEFLVTRLLLTLLLFYWGKVLFRASSITLQVLSTESGRLQVFQPRTKPLFEMVMKLTLVSIFIWFLLALWGIDGTAWLASAGVVGIAVGFAAKDTLANLISGLSIVADAPYKIGDYIVLDSGERGIVTSLGIRSTRLLTRDDVEISIPNSVMGNARISNECAGPAVQHRIRVPVGVAYGSDAGRVVSVLEKVAQDNSLIVDQPEPRVRMRDFGESSLDFELLGWISHSELRGLATHQLLMAIDRSFREEGIEIPFPQRDVHLHDI